MHSMKMKRKLPVVQQNVGMVSRPESRYVMMEKMKIKMDALLIVLKRNLVSHA